MSFFNASLKVPSGSAVKLENTLNNTVSLFANQSAFSGGDFALYLPGNYGASNQVLTTDGTGNLSWTTVSSGTGTSNISASNITLGSSAVLLSTTSGNVRINASTSEIVYVQTGNVSTAEFSSSNARIVKPLVITDTTATTNNSTGALILSGGAGIVGNVFVGSNLTVVDTSNLYGNVSVSGITRILNTTDSTNFNSGALVISGGMGVSGNVNVGNRLTATGFTDLQAGANISGTTNIINSSEASSTTTGAFIVSGGAGFGKSVYVGANLAVSGRVVYDVNSFTAASLVTTQALALWDNSNASTIKHIQPPTNATHYYQSNTSGSYTTGQNMHIFFTRPSSNTLATANIDFGSSNLYTGTGTAQYLVLTQPGQSASLIYLGGDDSIKGWRIINTGGQVY